MNYKIIEQVPFSKLKSCCPRCRTLCHNTQSYNVRLKEKKCEVECMLLYCRSCKIPFADFDIVQARYRRALVLFCPDCSWTIYDIISYMTTAKEQEYSYKYSYRVVSRQKYHNKSPRSIYHRDKIPKKCAKCDSSMKEGDVLIPISAVEAVLVPVKGCSKCSVFYVKGKSNLISVLMDNPYAKGITLDDIDYSRFTINQERKRREAIIRKKT